MQLGTFELKRILGQGGMAQVWLGAHYASGHEVAIKLMRREYQDHPEVHAQFIAEAQTLSRIRHPNIVRVYDFGFAERTLELNGGQRVEIGTPYYVMEHHPLGTLKEVASPSDWVDLRATLLAMLDGLALAHSRGLVHRDIKPSNILMSDHGPILSDFGIAYRTDRDTKNQDFGISGTPSFMAPEQVRDQRRMFGPWTDLYALGCMTYWLCSRTTPFSGSSFADIAYKQLKTIPEPLRAHFSIPEGLVGLTAKCLAKKPRHRFQFAADVVSAILSCQNQLIAGDIDVSQNGDEIEMLTRTEILMPTFQSQSLQESSPADKDPRTTANSKLLSISNDWRSIKAPSVIHHSGLCTRQSIRQSAPSFVGRVKARDTLWRALIDVKENGIRSVIVCGVPGVGKKALIQWFCEATHRLALALPLYLINSANDDELAGLEGMLKRELRALGLFQKELRDHIDARIEDEYLAQGFKNLFRAQETDPDTVLDILTQRARFELFGRWLTQLCEERPRILIVTHLDVVGEAQDFLQFLGHQYPTIKLLIVVLSENDTDPRAAYPFSTTNISLKPLSFESGLELIHTLLPLDQEGCRTLFVKSEGYPQRMVDLVYAACENDQLVREDDVFSLREGSSARQTLPEETLTAEMSNADLLWSAKTKEVIEVAACLGNIFRWSELNSLLDSMKIAIDHSMLSSLVKQGVWQMFEDDLVSFVDSSQYHKRRQAMKHTAAWQNKHTQIAEFLAIKGCTDFRRIAEHYLFGGHSQTALKYLDRAWQALIRQERYPEAKDIITQAIRTLKEAGVNCKDQDWLKWKLRWSQLSFWIGRPHQARRHALAVFIALPLLPKTRMHVDALMMAAHASKWMEGEGEQNIARLRRALDFANVIGSPQLIIKCYEQLGIYYHTYGALEDAKRCFERGLAQLRADETPNLKSLLHRGMARLLIEMDELPTARAHADRALNMLPVPRTSSSHAQIYVTLSDIERGLGRLDKAKNYAQLSVNIFREFGMPDLWAALANIGLIHYEDADWTSALDVFLEAVSVGKKVQNTSAIAMIESAMLRGLAQIKKWTTFDTILLKLTQFSDHSYAQYDSAKVLAALLEDGILSASRTVLVTELETAQKAALGLN